MAEFIVLRNSVEQAAWETFLETATEDEKKNPANFQGHKFKVIMGGWKPVLAKRMGVEETIGGALDVSVGHIFQGHDYTIRTKGQFYDYEDPNLGTRQDLEDYFMLNNPKGTPNNLVYLVDHYGTDSLDLPAAAGLLIGEHSPAPITTYIVGQEAHFTIQIQWRKLAAVA